MLATLCARFPVPAMILCETWIRQAGPGSRGLRIGAAVMVDDAAATGDADDMPSVASRASAWLEVKFKCIARYFLSFS